MRQRSDVGIGVIGTGKIGMQRARLAARHPAVDFLAVMDADADRAASVGEDLEADLVAESMEELVNDDRVGAHHHLHCGAVPPGSCSDRNRVWQTRPDRETVGHDVGGR